MSIGAVIKKLRKEKNFTQEQLAEYVGISAQAISQWECDKSAPDVYQIPVLAQIFNVSADVILEINESSIDIDIQEFLKEYDALGNQGKKIKQFDLTEAMYKKYPSDFRVIEKYILELFNDPHHMEEPFGETVHREQIQKLCELIIRDCTVQKIRYTAYDLMSVMYINSGDINRAKEICSYFPNSYYDIESELLEQLYCRTDRKMYIAQMRKNLLNLTEHIVNKLRNLATFGLDDPTQKIAVYKKCFDILNVIYDYEDAGFMLYHKGHIGCFIAKELFDLGDNKSAVKYMSTALEYCSKYDEIISGEEKVVIHNATVVNGVEENISQIFKTAEDTCIEYEVKKFEEFSKSRCLPTIFYEIIKRYTKD